MSDGHAAETCDEQPAADVALAKPTEPA